MLRLPMYAALAEKPPALSDGLVLVFIEGSRGRGVKAEAFIEFIGFVVFIGLKTGQSRLPAAMACASGLYNSTDPMNPRTHYTIFLKWERLPAAMSFVLVG